jgi:DNA-binding winged helix-turn-helix (wHTH) protein
MDAMEAVPGEVVSGRFVASVHHGSRRFCLIESPEPDVGHPVPCELTVAALPDGSQVQVVQGHAGSASGTFLWIRNLAGVEVQSANGAALLGSQAGTRRVISTTFHIEADTALEIVYRDGERVGLGPQQYRLLMYLADHPHQRLANQQILVAIWGPEWKGRSYYYVLYSGLNRLYSALGAARQIIVNDHGRGYMFEPEPKRRGPI